MKPDARYWPESNAGTKLNKSAVRNMMKRYEAPLTGADIMNGLDRHGASLYANLSRIGIMMTAAAMMTVAYKIFYHASGLSSKSARKSRESGRCPAPIDA
jgi:hypothetical protein